MTNPNTTSQTRDSIRKNPTRLYEVTVHRTDYLYTILRVEASSEEQAEQLAEQLADQQDISAWDIADRDRYTYFVQPVQKGACHE
jgi:hypothetical protein